MFHFLKKKQKGASLVEYGLLVGLIGVVLVIAGKDVGTSVSCLFHRVAAQMQNAAYACDNATGVTEAVTAAISAPTTTTYPTQPVAFTFGATGDVGTCAWNFGDGSAADTTCGDVTHSYGAAGTYTATLTVTTPTSGVSDTASQSVVITPWPTVTAAFSLSAPPLYPTQSVAFTYGAVGNIGACAWNFGDGSAVNTTCGDVTHSYTNAGNYTATLTVTSALSGASDMASRSVAISAWPVVTAAFTVPATAQRGADVAFTYGATGDVSTCAWDFGDGTAAATTCGNVTHAYTTTGSFTPTLTVTSSAGNTNQANQSLTITKPVTTYTLASGYSTTSNPSGPWSYGWHNVLTDPLILYNQTISAYNTGGYISTNVRWYNVNPYGDYTPLIIRNDLSTTEYGVAPGEISIHSGDAGYNFSTVRWTAPQAGQVSVTATFGAGDGGAMKYYVSAGSTLVDSFTDTSANVSKTFTYTRSVAVGDTLDFSVGPQAGGRGAGSTPIAVSVTLTAD